PVHPASSPRGTFARAAPTAETGPARTHSAAGDSPASTRISARWSTDRGVYEAGFTTIVFPQARAGAIFHVAITNGKFHGVMSAHTPTGSRRVTSSPASWTGTVSPKILLAAPPQY